MSVLMKRMLSVGLVMMLVLGRGARAQDPSFSQFFSSPLNINPALTANINADWRLISNLRDQWIGPASPYMTGSISFDRKIMQNKMAGVEEGNIMGIGGMLMFDHAMAGVAKSMWASLDFSYQIKLTDGNVKHKLGVGFGGIYGRRTVDATGPAESLVGPVPSTGSAQADKKRQDVIIQRAIGELGRFIAGILLNWQRKVRKQHPTFQSVQGLTPSRNTLHVGL